MIYLDNQTMQIENIFINFLAVDFIEIINLSEIEKFCYDKIFLDQGDPNQSDISVLQFDKFFSSIKLQIIQRLKLLLDKYSFSLSKRLEFDKIWINLNQNNNITSPHIHSGSLFSGILYIKAENSGEIVFMNPIAAHQYVIDPSCVNKFNEFTSYTIKVKPEVGKLIIFPSWLMHYVEPNQNNNDRISVAFNVKLLDV